MLRRLKAPGGLTISSSSLKENRTLAISAESARYATTSEIQLEDINAKRVFETEFRDIPQGDYDVTATVIGTEGRKATASRVVVIMR